MINLFSWRINPLAKELWEIPLEELYDRISGVVRSRKARFYIPSTESYCEADDYTLNGGYLRKKIIDIRLMKNEDGTFQYETIEIRDFRIQRILEKSTGHTHAILPEIFVPYRQYSLRYILLHVSEFYHQHHPKAQETYCLDAEIDIKAFKQWIKWMKDHITILAEIGLTADYRDNLELFRSWVQKLMAGTLNWMAKSLRKLNLGLFQEHVMPVNTMYQKYEPSG